MFIIMSFQKFREQVEKLVGQEYAGLLEIPKDVKDAGDIALPCFAVAKKHDKTPFDMAKLLEIDFYNRIKKFRLIGDIKATGPYVNFYVKEKAFLPMVIKEIITAKGKYGSSNIGSGKTVIVEYPSANIAKPMSVGHLRSGIIGQSLYNIHKFLSYRVISDDHLGDWGTQFGKLLYAYNTWGDLKSVSKNPIKEMLELYIKFHDEAKQNPQLEQEARDWFARLEKGDKKALKIWKLFCKWSLQELGRIYKKLGLHLDYQLGESFYISTAKQVIKEALAKGVAKEEQGAVLIPMNGTPLLIQKSDESTLYATRDLATIKYRMKKFHPYKILYAVGSEQNLYFRQIFFAAKQLGYIKDEGAHVNFGLVSLPEGRMSTREGRIVFLEDLISETIKEAIKAIEEKNPKLKNKKEIAEMIAMAAIKYNDISRDRIRDIVFDWKEALSFEGDTGPYLQYTAVRANSIISKSRKRYSTKNLDVLVNKNEAEIVKMLSKFFDTVINSHNDYKPHYIANYLNNLAAKFNEYYHNTKIIGSKEEQQRLALVFCVGTVLTTGLRLLGIEVPEKM